MHLSDVLGHILLCGESLGKESEELSKKTEFKLWDQ